MRLLQSSVFTIACCFCVDALALTGADVGKMVTDIQSSFAEALAMKKTALANNFYNLERKPYCAYLKEHSTLGVRIIGHISMFNESIRSLGSGAEQALRDNPEFKGLFSVLKQMEVLAESEAREDDAMLKRYCVTAEGKEAAAVDGIASGNAADSPSGWASIIDDTQGGNAFSILPDAPRKGIVINFPEKRMYVYSKVAEDERPVSVMSNPFKLPRVEKAPFGATSISARRNDPPGSFAIYFWGKRCLIHGAAEKRSADHDHSRTDSAASVRNEFELSREDMARLFRSTDIGSQVWMVNQPIKAGWREGELYIEVHPPFGEDSRTPDELLGWIMPMIDKITVGRTAYPLDVATLKQALRQRRGIPVRIGQGRRLG